MVKWTKVKDSGYPVEDGQYLIYSDIKSYLANGMFANFNVSDQVFIDTEYSISIPKSDVTHWAIFKLPPYE